MRGGGVRGEHVLHLRHEADDVLDENERDGVVLFALALGPQDILVTSENKGGRNEG